MNWKFKFYQMMYISNKDLLNGKQAFPRTYGMHHMKNLSKLRNRKKCAQWKIFKNCQEIFSEGIHSNIVKNHQKYKTNV